jgi:rSAM/selenodomain-associated transferase 2
MLTVVIPTLNAEQGLAATLGALVPAAVDGLIREVIVVDGGSDDRTIEIADDAGAEVIRTAPGRGLQLAEGAARARWPWLMFLHADTVLQPGWEREAAKFMDKIDTGRRRPAAAAFRFALDDDGMAPRLLEAGVRLRCGVLGLPYGDQGLLISKRLYKEVGGFRPLPLMEDVDLVRRVRGGVVVLRADAVTSAARYREGYARRVARNLSCLTLYYLNAPMNWIARLYAPPERPT